MAKYWKGVWNSLKFSAGSSVDELLKATGNYSASLLGPNYLLGRDGVIKYVGNKHYDSVLVYTAKRMVAQALQAEIDKALPRYQKYLQDKRREEYKAQAKTVDNTILKNGEIVDKKYGEIGDGIVAMDPYGNPVREALIIWYEGDPEIKDSLLPIPLGTTTTETVGKKNSPYASQTSGGTSGKYVPSVTTKKVFVIDLAPKITLQSTKNLQLTKVQGRDYTRKELISGGDLVFSVSGEFNSGYAGVYPTRDVQKFTAIMKHNGIISVNNMFFGNQNVTRILIQNFQLGQQEYKNIQPYSFTCVAVEPDTEVSVTDDTINGLTQIIKSSPAKGWERFILNSKLAEISADIAGDTVTPWTLMGIDAMLPNI